MVLPLAGVAPHPSGRISAAEDEAGREKARESRSGGDPGRKERQYRLAEHHQPERARPPHRAPDPVTSVVNVLTQTARSMTSERWRRYQRSYDSLSAVPSASAV